MQAMNLGLDCCAETRFGSSKTLRQVTAQSGTEQWRAYEIHMGATRALSAVEPLHTVTDDEGARPEGMRRANVWGTYLHGWFESPQLRARVAAAAGMNAHRPYPVPWAEQRARIYRSMAEHLAAHVDLDPIRRCLAFDANSLRSRHSCSRHSCSRHSRSRHTRSRCSSALHHRRRPGIRQEHPAPRPGRRRRALLRGSLESADTRAAWLEPAGCFPGAICGDSHKNAARECGRNLGTAHSAGDVFSIAACPILSRLSDEPRRAKRTRRLAGGLPQLRTRGIFRPAMARNLRKRCRAAANLYRSAEFRRPPIRRAYLDCGFRLVDLVIGSVSVRLGQVQTSSSTPSGELLHQHSPQRKRPWVN